MGEEKKAPSGVWPTVKPFVNGGASGMLATCVIQPIDMIKVPCFLVSMSHHSIFNRVCWIYGVVLDLDSDGIFIYSLLGFYFFL